MDIKDFNVVCINLVSRPDRWEESKKEFSKSHLLPYVYRYEAIAHSNPIEGCASSHFDVLQQCLDLDKHAMIFEDDVKFINNYNEMPSYLRELSSIDWDMLYLGANITTQIDSVSEWFAKVSHAQSTHAYCANRKFIPTVLEHKHLIGKHMDLIYAENVIPKGNCFITRPMMAIQRPSFSDIEKRYVNYTWMQDRYNKHLAERQD